VSSKAAIADLGGARLRANFQQTDLIAQDRTKLCANLGLVNGQFDIQAEWYACTHKVTPLKFICAT
jgi:hypothetical protein